MNLLLFLLAGLASSVLAAPKDVPRHPTTVNGTTTYSPSRGTGSSSKTSSTTNPPDTHTRPPPGPTTVYTTTETVTRYSFFPHSTAVSVSGAKTYYSTFVTSQAYTTTTCYPITTVTPPPGKITTSPNAPNPPQCEATHTVTNCPTETKTIYITPLTPHETVVPAPPKCSHECQTITYTDASSSTITIIIPSQSTNKPNEPTNKPPSPPYPSPSGTTKNPPVGPTGGEHAPYPSPSNSSKNAPPRPSGTGAAHPKV